ncbi:uncharacterized protein LOC141628458 [Silene latifolia]|uniref:uncharacterized protein LOC141628458 n=1 Tax=Silene latifolia TaxID=37657 RepID=UPI003D78459A
MKTLALQAQEIMQAKDAIIKRLKTQLAQHGVMPSTPIPDNDKEELKNQSYPVRVPFPGRLPPRSTFKDLLRSLEIAKPFDELIAQVTSYASFMKKILWSKRDINNIEMVAFTEECSALLQNRTPLKLSGPGSFSIPCHIGTYLIDNALYDIGASVSVLPLSITKRLGLTKFQCTGMTVQMADRSLSRPLGVLEDVPVRIGRLFIPVDFFVLDIPEDTRTSIILGRPFLHTAGAIVDVGSRTLTFQVGGEDLVFI